MVLHGSIQRQKMSFAGHVLRRSRGKPSYRTLCIVINNGVKLLLQLMHWNVAAVNDPLNIELYFLAICNSVSACMYLSLIHI